MLTDAQLTDARRYLGYPLNGTTFVVTNDQDTVYMRFGMAIMSLHTRLTSLSATEEAVVDTYLTTLNTLEAAIPGSGANLDTDQAAVWKHNKNEVADRSKLYDQWRRRFCEFIGIAPGPTLGSGGSIALVRA